MKHHCSPHNCPAQLAKLTGNIHVTGKPRRQKQTSRAQGEGDMWLGKRHPVPKQLEGLQ